MENERLKLAIQYLTLLKELPGKHFREVDRCISFIEQEFGIVDDSEIVSPDADRFMKEVSSKLNARGISY